MFRRLKTRTARTVLYGLIFLLCVLLPVACSSVPKATGKTIRVASSPWPGYASHWVALEKGLFKDEGVEVKDVFFVSQTESDDAFMTGKADLNLNGMPGTIPQINRDPGVKIFYQLDYSDGSDGILGRNLKTAADLKGKTVARENVLFEEMLLRKYLEKLGLPRNQIKVVNKTAPEAATAFAAGKVDAAVTFEPWMTKAAKDGKGEVVFSTKGTNIIADIVTARADFIAQNEDALLAYIRALNKAVKLMRENPAETNPIIAKKFGVKPEEVPDQLAGVKLYDLEMNQTISFNPANPMNLFDSLEFASRVANQIKLIPQPIDVNSGLDDSLVRSF
jgi:NitT/TauT family transport system substrate-binding protein